MANQAVLAVTVLGILVGAGSLVVRFRRARGTERRQLRWVVLAAALTGVGMLASVVLVAADNEVLVGWVGAVCVAFLPLAIGAAVLRTGCSIWTASSAAPWPTACSPWSWGCAMWPGRWCLCWWLVPARTLRVGWSPPRPWRRQQYSDRPAAASRLWWIGGFNRRRYDAAQAIAAFSTRLRDEFDLDALEVELLAVVDQTVQPAKAFLWLRPPTQVSPQVKVSKPVQP